MTPIIEARELCVDAGGVHCIARVGVRVMPGERVALVGNNGAGKSTLLRALSGFAPVSSGSLRVLDSALERTLRPRALRALRARVARIHQGLDLVERLSALDNVLIASAGRHRSPLTWMRRWPAFERRSASAALDRVGMGWAAARRTDSLSGGERQKVAIARALHQRAPILLADEPTASLDTNAAGEIAALLAAVVADAGTAMLCIVHDLDLVPKLAQRALVLRRGRLVADVKVTPSTPHELRALLQ